MFFLNFRCSFWNFDILIFDILTLSQFEYIWIYKLSSFVLNYTIRLDSTRNVYIWGSYVLNTICLSACLCVCPSVRLSICPSVCVFVCLFICMFRSKTVHTFRLQTADHRERLRTKSRPEMVLRHHVSPLPRLHNSGNRLDNGLHRKTDKLGSGKTGLSTSLLLQNVRLANHHHFPTDFLSCRSWGNGHGQWFSLPACPW